jgi:hypothetical protein
MDKAVALINFLLAEPGFFQMQHHSRHLSSQYNFFPDSATGRTSDIRDWTIKRSFIHLPEPSSPGDQILPVLIFQQHHVIQIPFCAFFLGRLPVVPDLCFVVCERSSLRERNEFVDTTTPIYEVFVQDNATSEFAIAIQDAESFQPFARVFEFTAQRLLRVFRFDTESCRPGPELQKSLVRCRRYVFGKMGSNVEWPSRHCFEEVIAVQVS